MDVHTIRPMTPSLSYGNINHWNSEDSGYHTSFTPGSAECSKVSSDNFSTNYNNKIGISGQFWLRYNNDFSTSNDSYIENSPQSRRGIKRAYQECSESTELDHTSIPTPTSLISGNLRKLRFSEHKVSFFSPNFGTKEQLEQDNRPHNEHQSYPTTPVKKSCKSNCKLNRPFNSSRKLPQRINFEIHSLTCENQELQPIPVIAKPNFNEKQFHFKPNQKIDIIKMLYLKARVTPPLSKIFSFLSIKDIHNVTLVSQHWQKAWECSSSESQNREYFNFCKNIRENLENKMATPKNKTKTQIRPLTEMQNKLNNNHQIGSLVSPPGSPRTMRFKKYTEAASLDSRKQLPCLKCHQPAKINEETTGEEWVECTNSTCAKQFCRFCKFERHPGKKCIQYDLEGPSPSKRKKNIHSICTKKSRKNLRRLLN